MPGGRGLTTTSSAYVRFIILADPRTGSNMLARALDSSPHITCFSELFNSGVDFIAFDVEGYDNFSARDRALRDGDFEEFLCQRIFCRHPEAIRAVGYKLLYDHVWGFPGLLDSLVEDTEIRVLHLGRRNLLRRLASLKLAAATGVWLEMAGPKFTPAGMLTAARHPLRAAARLWGLLRPPETTQRARRARVTIPVEECWFFFNRTQSSVAHFDYVFRAHPKFTLVYEDFLQRRDEVFDRVQAFLGVEPGPLTVTLRRQNPQPLEELVENYEELCEAFSGTPYETFFD